MKSGQPGGASSARGRIRVTGSPSSSASHLAAGRRVAFWKPVNGSVRTSMRVSHFTCAIPYQPGTSSRSGAPCCGGSGAPFIAQTSRTSGRSASASESPRA